MAHQSEEHHGFHRHLAKAQVIPPFFHRFQEAILRDRVVHCGLALCARRSGR